MTIEFVDLNDGSLAVEGHNAGTREELRAALKGWFATNMPGLDEWDAEDALGRVRFDRTYYSDSYRGFTHDCAGHEAHEATAPCKDSRPIIIVANMPEPAPAPVAATPVHVARELAEGVSTVG